MRQESYIEGHNQTYYALINKDNNLIGTKQNQLYIKMHKDTEQLDSIVLKEDDYLNYSQTHIFIETIIKSLLIDHTFLFIGYGIGDYNLKLIMNWVDNLVEKHPDSHSERRPHFFFYFGGKPLQPHEINYYEKKNIKVISAENFPEYIKKLEITDFKSELGNNCLRYLKYIQQGPYQKEGIEYLKDKLAIFSSQSMILILHLIMFC